MHGEHDALPVVPGNGDSSLFVAATLAALVLAGSALVYRKTYEQHQPEHGKLTQPSEHSTPDDMETEKHHLPDVHSYADGPSSAHDPDSKESKSSRSKDRRRRGKDPLKEILKGGKKLKSTPTTPLKQLFADKPILDDFDNHHHNSINNTPTSSTPASFTTPNSFSRSSGKRAQEDNSLFNLPAVSVDTASSVHSRTTSEVSQSNTGSKTLDPHQHTRDRTASNSDDHVLTPSQASFFSLSHTETENNTIISEQRNPDTLSRQTRETHLVVPTPSIFSTIIQNNDDFSETFNHSVPSSASSTTNATTVSCVITPATSPSLSYTISSDLVPVPSPVGVNSELANKGSDSDGGSKNNPTSEPSHAQDIDTKSRKISRKQPFPSPTSSTKTRANAQNSWEWNNTGEAVLVLPSPSSISASVIASAPLSPTTPSLITAPTFPPDIVYRKPPRLITKSLWSKNVKSDTSSSIPGSVSQPSLLSPTSGSFMPLDSALLSPSVSSSLEKVPSSVSKVAEEGESEGEERDKAGDSYTQLEFPTLNPMVSTSSSLASTGNSGPTASSSTAGPSNNHRPTTPRRVRRPPTPPDSTPPHLNSGSGQLPPTHIAAVSTQTQLASLRGALEAARLREEKHKAEIERCTKELEALRWENVNVKRGEVELQNYAQHLMHQLQIYTFLFAGVSPSLTPQPSQQTQGPMAGSARTGDRAASGSGSSSGPTSPGTQNVQNSAAAPILGPSPPMHLPPLSLNGLSSPVSASGAFPPPMSSMHAPSPYFSYPMPPPSLHPHTVMSSPHPMFTQQFHHIQQQFLQFQQYQQQPHTQNQSQSPTIQVQQANLFSTLHPPSLVTNSSYQSAASSSSSMASGSRSSSRPGTESAGSSPDLNGSPSPAPGSKRRTRTRTQTTNGYIGGRAEWNGTSDGWVIGGVGIDEGDEGGHESVYEWEAQAESGDGDEDEGGYNELLADAIFKRPDRLGVRSGKNSKQALLEKEMEKEKSKDRELLENEVLDTVEPLTEFKFPSLSNLGNVHNRSHSQSSASSSSMVLSPAPEDLESNVFHLQALSDRPLPDIVHAEAAVSQNGVEPDNRNENQPTLDTASSRPRSERTPPREESSNITEPLMDLNGVEATNVREGQ